MSDKITVQSGVPVPGDRTRNEPNYPWLQMKVGDSFVVYGRTMAASARGSFKRYQKMGKIPANWSVTQRMSVEPSTIDGPSIRLWIVDDEQGRTCSDGSSR